MDGLLKAGYNNFNIDDCWLAEHEGGTKVQRPKGHVLEADPIRFPGGMGLFSTWVRTLGFDFGIYSDAGSHTCQGYFGSPPWAIKDDSRLFFKKWHSSFLKLDGCHMDARTGPDVYRQWSREIRALERETRNTHTFSCSWPAYWLDPYNQKTETAYKKLRTLANDWPVAINDDALHVAALRKRLVWMSRGGLDELAVLEQSTRETLIQWAFNVDISEFLKDDNRDVSPLPANVRELVETVRMYRSDIQGMASMPWRDLQETCDLWRLYGDIYNDWRSVKSITHYWQKHQKVLAESQRPGAYHDPDMLITGIPGVTSIEGRAQVSLWTLWGAPLIMGHDPRGANPRSVEILTNGRVLDLQQTNPGVMGRQTALGVHARDLPTVESKWIRDAAWALVKWKDCAGDDEKCRKERMKAEEKFIRLIESPLSRDLSAWRKPLVPGPDGGEKGAQLLALVNLGDDRREALEVDLGGVFGIDAKAPFALTDAWAEGERAPEVECIWKDKATGYDANAEDDNKDDNNNANGRELVRKLIRVTLEPRETLLLVLTPTPEGKGDHGCSRGRARVYISPATLRDIEMDREWNDKMEAEQIAKAEKEKAKKEASAAALAASKKYSAAASALPVLMEGIPASPKAAEGVLSEAAMPHKDRVAATERLRAALGEDVQIERM